MIVGYIVKGKKISQKVSWETRLEFVSRKSCALLSLNILFPQRVIIISTAKIVGIMLRPCPYAIPYTIYIRQIDQWVDWHLECFSANHLNWEALLLQLYSKPALAKNPNCNFPLYPSIPRLLKLRAAGCFRKRSTGWGGEE